jgi:hypothetical protein
MLFGQATRERRCLDAPPLRVRSGRNGVGGALAKLPVAGGLFHSGVRRRRFGRVGVRRFFGRIAVIVGRAVVEQVGDVFSFLAQDGNQLPDRDGVAFANQLLEQDAVVERLQVHRRLVSFHLGDDVAGRHLVALICQPGR